MSWAALSHALIVHEFCSVDLKCQSPVEDLVFSGAMFTGVAFGKPLDHEDFDFSRGLSY